LDLISGISFLSALHGAGFPWARITNLEAIHFAPELAAVAIAMIVVYGIKVITTG
jgi:hypothetical protein